MNERIQELLERAEKYADDNFRGEPTWSEAFELMFAELIIKECIQVCINEGKTYEVKSAGEYSSNLYASAIKKHFDMNSNVLAGAEQMAGAGGYRIGTKEGYDEFVKKRNGVKERTDYKVICDRTNNP